MPMCRGPTGFTWAWYMLFLPWQRLQWDGGWTKGLCPHGLAPDPYVSMEQVVVRTALTRLIPSVCSMSTNLRVEGLSSISSTTKSNITFDGVSYSCVRKAYCSCSYWSYSLTVDVFRRQVSLLAWNNSDGSMVLYIWHSYVTPQGQPRGSRSWTAVIIATTTLTTFPVVEMQQETQETAAAGDFLFYPYFLQTPQWAGLCARPSIGSTSTKMRVLLSESSWCTEEVKRVHSEGGEVFLIGAILLGAVSWPLKWNAIKTSFCNKSLGVKLQQSSESHVASCSLCLPFWV